MRNSKPDLLDRAPRQLPLVATLLGVLLLTVVASWVYGRWSQNAEAWVTATPQGPLDTASVLWHLERLSGVQAVAAVHTASLSPDEIEPTGWSEALVVFLETTGRSPGLSPPSPGLDLREGRLATSNSLDEAVVAYELARQLGLAVGQTMLIRERVFRIVGIWQPSARNPGNWVQVSFSAGRALLGASISVPHHFIVVASDTASAQGVASAIWHKIPELAVSSPEGLMRQESSERAVLVLALCGAMVLSILLMLPLWAEMGATAERWVELMAWAVIASALGWLCVGAANGYTRRAMALSPLRCSLLGIGLMLGAIGLISWVTPRIRALRAMGLHEAAVIGVVSLCVASCALVGALRDSLRLSLSEAYQAAADWVSLEGAEASPDLIQAVRLLPGVRGYIVEARGGPADADEERWVGAVPSAGILYGRQSAGATGALSVPYVMALEAGRARDSDVWNEAVLGHDLADHLGAHVGDMLQVRGHHLTVVGVYRRLPYDPGNDMNRRIELSLQGLQRVLRACSISGEVTLLIPPSRTLDEKAYYLSEVQSRLAGVQVSTVEDSMARIVSGYPSAWTLTGASAEAEVRHGTDLYLGLFLLACIPLAAACAISVMGALGSRTRLDRRQIALSKAAGMDEGRLLGEYVEQILIWGTAGATAGSLLGAWIVSTLNQLDPVGTVPMLLTPQAVAWAAGLMLLACLVGGMLPANRSVRQDVAALLYECTPVQ